MANCLFGKMVIFSEHLDLCWRYQTEVCVAMKRVPTTYTVVQLKCPLVFIRCVQIEKLNLSHFSFVRMAAKIISVRLVWLQMSKLGYICVDC